MAACNQNITSVMVTGNLGYIGSVLVPILCQMGYRVIGLDAGFYESQPALYAPRHLPARQIVKDVRDLQAQDLEGVDAVIHLAALSNDPLGELDPAVTEEINLRATLRVADLARQVGVRRFIFASSQSMYGIADCGDELDEDNSEKNPLTAYARTKWEAECALKEMTNEEFTVTSFRPSTVFGQSPKLRCDIVYNNLLACAYTSGTIEIKSDGTPWRPVIHVEDVSKAFIAGLTAPGELVNREAFNIGLPHGNFTVRQLAETAQRVVAGSTLTFTGEHGPDSRTYRVSFKKILTKLADDFIPQWSLWQGGQDLIRRFERIGFGLEDFRGSRCHRLRQLKSLIQSGTLNEKLRWVG